VAQYASNMGAANGFASLAQQYGARQKLARLALGGDSCAQQRGDARAVRKLRPNHLYEDWDRDVGQTPSRFSSKVAVTISDTGHQGGLGRQRTAARRRHELLSHYTTPIRSPPSRASRCRM